MSAIFVFALSAMKQYSLFTNKSEKENYSKYINNIILNLFGKKKTSKAIEIRELLSIKELSDTYETCARASALIGDYLNEASTQNKIRKRITENTKIRISSAFQTANFGVLLCDPPYAGTGFPIELFDSIAEDKKLPLERIVSGNKLFFKHQLEGHSSRDLFNINFDDEKPMAKADFGRIYKEIIIDVRSSSDYSRYINFEDNLERIRLRILESLGDTQITPFKRDTTTTQSSLTG